METVRYYQRRGLFPEPPRPLRSTREYSPEALALLRFIRRARGLGFTIKEIERLLALRQSRKDSGELPIMLAEKTADLEREVRTLQAAVAALADIAARCDATPAAEQWRLFDSDEE